MDGLNQRYREYGYNEEHLFVMQINSSWISINYWADVNGCEYPSVDSSGGGYELYSAFRNNPMNGTMLLIYPDRSFKGALPERYGKNEGIATFEEIFEDADIPKSNTASIGRHAGTSIKNSNLFSLSSISNNTELTFLQDGIASISLYRLNGQCLSLNEHHYAVAGSKLALPNMKSAAPGIYLLEVTLNGVAQKEKISLQ